MVVRGIIKKISNFRLLVAFSILCYNAILEGKTSIENKLCPV